MSFIIFFISPEISRSKGRCSTTRSSTGVSGRGSRPALLWPVDLDLDRALETLGIQLKAQRANCRSFMSSGYRLPLSLSLYFPCKVTSPSSVHGATFLAHKLVCIFGGKKVLMQTPRLYFVFPLLLRPMKTMIVDHKLYSLWQWLVFRYIVAGEIFSLSFPFGVPMMSRCARA